MFNLDKTTHTYTLNGEPIVSVSQVISPLSDFSSIDPDVMKRAKDYGTAVHRMVELYIGGDLDEEALDSGLKGPLEAFRLWWG
ncbi:MAG: hypothetical protein A3K22_02185 [Deltaproteobacteria bacterium RBG_16_42_7]|nr:MAG: hypothetical protein A3K22_02185 [Deltaproteobacteria bacterium RBG_16_42_7]